MQPQSQSQPQPSPSQPTQLTPSTPSQSQSQSASASASQTTPGSGGDSSTSRRAAPPRLTLHRLAELAMKPGPELMALLNHTCSMRGVVSEVSGINLKQQYLIAQCRLCSGNGDDTLVATTTKLQFMDVSGGVPSREERERCFPRCPTCEAQLEVVPLPDDYGRPTHAVDCEQQVLILSNRGQQLANDPAELKAIEVVWWKKKSEQKDESDEGVDVSVGDPIEVHGLLVTRVDKEMAQETICLIAYHIHKLTQAMLIEPVVKLKDKFHTLIAQQNPMQLLVHSLCPDVLGQDLPKLGLVLALFSGVGDGDDPSSLRTAIHVALVDEAPSLARDKSISTRLLEAVVQFAPLAAFQSLSDPRVRAATEPVRTYMTQGRRAVQATPKNPLTVLDEGLLAMSVGGDWSFPVQVVHPQLISLMEGDDLVFSSKDGLGFRVPRKYRTAVIMGGHPLQKSNKPKDGSTTLHENLGVTNEILDHFDLIFLLRTTLEKEHIGAYIDRELSGGTPKASPSLGYASPLVTSANASPSISSSPRIVPATPESKIAGSARHLKRKIAAPGGGLEPIPVDVMRKYILYARGQPLPKFNEEARILLDKLFMERVPQQDARFLWKAIRLCQACARLELASEVTATHVDDVIQLLTYVTSDLDLDGSAEHLDLRKGGARGGSTLRQARNRVIELMLNYSEQFNPPVYIHNLTTCWKVVSENMRPLPCADNEFRPFMDKLKEMGGCLQGSEGKYKFQPSIRTCT